MRLFVTGADGFIGGWIMRCLREETAHVALPFPADICRPADFPREPVAAIVHTAALITHAGAHTADDFARVNVEGTRHLLTAWPEAHMVFLSTTDVTRPQPDAYARSKLAAEELVLRRPQNAVLRLPSVFGPAMRQRDKLIPRLFRHFLAGEPLALRNDEEREYVYVGDVARRAVAALAGHGLTTVAGHRIRNHALAALVQAVCAGAAAPAGADAAFVAALRQCLPAAAGAAP